MSSSIESSRVVSFRVYILAVLVKQREYFISFFFGMSIQKVRKKGTQAEELRLREGDVKAWKCIVVFGELFPHRDE